MRSSVNQGADPFGEQAARPHHRNLQLLGARFHFESNSARLLQLVDQAFAGLPRHRLGGRSPRLLVRLQLTTRQQRAAAAAAAPPPLNTYAGPGFLCGAIDQSNLAVISPAGRSALVVVSRDMLRHAYHLRYELIEFAVYVLAARALQLVPLHAAAVGRQGRGLLLMGDSGAGKSTIALHCLMQGLEILSEDAVFVAPAGAATGIANFFHLQRRGLRFLRDHAGARRIRSSPIIRRRSGVEKYEVDLRRSGYRLASAPLSIQALVFLSKRRGDDDHLLVPLAARQRAARLTALQPYAAGQQGWRRFENSLAGVRTFELRRGSHPAVAVAALRSLLDPPKRSAPRA
jgi:hypothetical protein